MTLYYWVSLSKVKIIFEIYSYPIVALMKYTKSEISIFFSKSIEVACIYEYSAIESLNIFET
jgi:hypothetical protein